MMQHDSSVPGESLPSAAIGQNAVGDVATRYPLWPPLTQGCGDSGDFSMPAEVTYDYGQVPPSLFKRSSLPSTLQFWSPLLPPLDERLELGAGGTPLLQAEPLTDYLDGTELYVKDESRNPTWSHKDRLNLCTVSAATKGKAPGVVVASSGNHGASAAAYAARAGLPCIVVTGGGLPVSTRAFLRAYGATIVSVPIDSRWDVVRDIVDKLGYHPVSNLTPTHTGHAFGQEGYKTIAYEIFIQLGHRVPAAVFVPTGYAELLYGIWKGFRELVTLDVAQSLPRMYSAEPAARGPLAAAMAAGRGAIEVDARPTRASAIATTIGGYRGVVAITESGGRPLLVEDEAMVDAQARLGRCGWWQELSGAAGLAAARMVIESDETIDGAVVCIATSSGFKDCSDDREVAEIDPCWTSVRAKLEEEGGIAVPPRDATPRAESLGSK